MLKRCEDTNLALNWEKSHFMVKEGIVLGHKISKKGIEVDKAKIDVISKLPHPTTVKGIRSFLGHAGFYRRFIKDFSKISRPMTHLLEKNTPFIFSEDCILAFQTLKKKLTEAPILIAPNWDQPFEIMCDASDYAIGAVLGQRIEKHFRPIHYASKTMTEAETNYTTTEKEMLAIYACDVDVLSQWSLIGSDGVDGIASVLRISPYDIKSDTFLISMSDLSEYVAFWALAWAFFTLDILLSVLSIQRSEHSTVTYTSVSFPVEDDSDIGSPGVDGPPILQRTYAYIMVLYEVPPSPELSYLALWFHNRRIPYLAHGFHHRLTTYLAEEPQSLPIGLVPEPMYPEYMPQEDEILQAEEQPLPAAASSPTADSPGYVPKSNLEEEPEENDEDPEEDPTDYPADGDDDDDEDKDDDKDEEEEEEHPTPAALSHLYTIPSPPLPIPSPPPNSPNHIEILESCLPLWKRVRFASPTPSHEVGESSAAGAARQDGPAVAREDPYSVARGDLYGFVDMVDVALSALISELQSADHRRQRVISELLASDHKRQVQLTKTLRLLKGLQTQMVELQRQHGPAKGPAQPDAPGEAGSSS
ncbi:reverse transcriptase domain-containing protein [Tanacetum coccineum]